TVFGGGTGCGGSGCGIVFKLDPTGKETVLYAFTGGSDGYSPLGPLVQDSAGNLYGTTVYLGTIFRLDTSGKLTTLYSFTGGADGYSPGGSLVRDGAGNLYGTCARGGKGSGGTVYKLDTSGTLTVLHAFNDTRDGYSPGGLISDDAG